MARLALLTLLAALLGLTHGAEVARANRALRGNPNYYTDMAKPPSWVQAPAGVLPGVPLTQPAPIAAAGIIPADPYSAANYFDSAPPQIMMPQELAGGVPKDNGKAWPPSPPLFPNSLSWAGTAPMRPLTLLDAKGGEYAKASEKDKKNKKKK